VPLRGWPVVRECVDGPGEWVGTAAQPQENQMPIGNFDAGTHGQRTITFARGRYTTLGLLCDNGFLQNPPPQLRVAIHTSTKNAGTGEWEGTWVVHRHVVVDSAGPQVVIDFTDPDHTDGIGLSYEEGDPGIVNVGWEVS